jgi:hypothetical protein
VALLLVLLIGWGASVFGSQYIALDVNALRIANAIHVMALVLGFGAVLSVMFAGLRSLLGWIPFSVATRVAVTLDPGVWIGYTALMISGIFLRPALNPVMWIKLVLVLVAAANGIVALPSMKVLLAQPADAGIRDIPRPLAIQLFAQVTISQLAWWVTIFLSFFYISPTSQP